MTLKRLTPSLFARRAAKRPNPAGSRALVRYAGTIVVAAMMLCGCQLVPHQPEAVFVLYRDRMKSKNLEEARSLLTSDSRMLALQLATDHKLRQAPESLALLNALDPLGTPVVMKSDETSALLQLRTLKGGLRLIRLIRKDPNSPWKIDITDELQSLQSFLEARSTLDMIREQAGEYAATYRAFSDQLDKMHVPEPPPVKAATLKSPAPKQRKKPKAQKKSSTKKKGHKKQVNRR